MEYHSQMMINHAFPLWRSFETIHWKYDVWWWIQSFPHILVSEVPMKDPNWAVAAKPRLVDDYFGGYTNQYIGYHNPWTGNPYQPASIEGWHKVSNTAHLNTARWLLPLEVERWYVHTKARPMMTAQLVGDVLLSRISRMLRGDLSLWKRRMVMK